VGHELQETKCQVRDSEAFRTKAESADVDARTLIEALQSELMQRTAESNNLRDELDKLRKVQHKLLFENPTSEFTQSRKEDEAATAIQKRYRGGRQRAALESEKARRKEQDHEKQEAATKIQKRYRGNRQREALQAEKARQELQGCKSLKVDRGCDSSEDDRTDLLSPTSASLQVENPDHHQSQAFKTSESVDQEEEPKAFLVLLPDPSSSAHQVEDHRSCVSQALKILETVDGSEQPEAGSLNAPSLTDEVEEPGSRHFQAFKILEGVHGGEEPVAGSLNVSSLTHDVEDPGPEMLHTAETHLQNSVDEAFGLELSNTQKLEIQASPSLEGADDSNDNFEYQDYSDASPGRSKPNSTINAPKATVQASHHLDESYDNLEFHNDSDASDAEVSQAASSPSRSQCKRTDADKARDPDPLEDSGIIDSVVEDAGPLEDSGVELDEEIASCESHPKCIKTNPNISLEESTRLDSGMEVEMQEKPNPPTPTLEGEAVYDSEFEEESCAD